LGACAEGALSDVTVVVTCFDYGRYLAEAVGSALAQEGGAPHVVVVDDGSTDPETLAVLERLPPEVTVVRQQNRGPAAARNVGFARAETPYLLALDADDRLAPGALTTLRRALESRSEAAFAYGLSRFFGDWEGILRFPPYDPYRLLYRHIVGLSALMRREVFARTGGYDESFPSFEDWEFWVNALAHGQRGVQVPEVTLEYRQHRRSKSQTDGRRYRAAFARLREKHADLYRERDRFAAESSLGALGRAAYRCYWGPRPVPAKLERSLYGLLWRPRRRG
jgi:glycosyltransferase involved in cell wall biosynthesis